MFFRRCLSVCLFVSNFARLNFGGYPDHRMGTGIVFLIRHHWEIVAKAHSFILVCQNDGGTGETFFGGLCLGKVDETESGMKRLTSDTRLGTQWDNSW